MSMYRPLPFIRALILGLLCIAYITAARPVSGNAEPSPSRSPDIEPIHRTASINFYHGYCCSSESCYKGTAETVSLLKQRIESAIKNKARSIQTKGLLRSDQYEPEVGVKVVFDETQTPAFVDGKIEFDITWKTGELEPYTTKGEVVEKFGQQASYWSVNVPIVPPAIAGKKFAVHGAIRGAGAQYSSTMGRPIA